MTRGVTSSSVDQRSARVTNPLSGNVGDAVTTIITVVLVALLVVGVIGFSAIVVYPVELGEPYTEFYLLNMDGKAGEYPTDLSVGEEGTVVVGIENHEHKDMTYTVVVWTRQGISEKRVVSVNDEDRWRGEFSYRFEFSGNQTVVFALYRGASPDLGHQPYRRIYLYITVR